MTTLCTQFASFLKATLVLIVFCALSQQASAIVLHDDAQVEDHPPQEIMGRWGSNASCVAIGPDLVITTNHQGSCSTVVINGVSYGVSQQWVNDNDFRIARLTLNGQRAALTHWVAISDKDYSNSEVVIGGFGRGRGDILSGSGGVYGYLWKSETNTTLRWGANRINYTSGDRLVSDFDAADHISAVHYEAAIAEHDSGGGWFVKEGGKWLLAGLSNGVENSGKSVFATESGLADPDKNYAVALGNFNSWISTTLREQMPQSGDRDFDGDVDADDMATFSHFYGKSSDATWQQGNVDGDGDVDLVDLGLIAKNIAAKSD